MIYIICALHAEASHLIQRYDLQKNQSTPFALYEGADIKLILSGIGKINAAMAMTYLIERFSNPQAKIYNIGTCSSIDTSLPIGELLTIHKIIDQSTQKVYHLECQGHAITCVDIALSCSKNIKTPLVDMESTALYLVAKKFALPLVLLKIVSDYHDTCIPSSQTIESLFLKQGDALSAYLS